MNLGQANHAAYDMCDIQRGCCSNSWCGSSCHSVSPGSLYSVLPGVCVAHVPEVSDHGCNEGAHKKNSKNTNVLIKVVFQLLLLCQDLLIINEVFPPGFPLHFEGTCQATIFCLSTRSNLLLCHLYAGAKV